MSEYGGKCVNVCVCVCVRQRKRDLLLLEELINAFSIIGMSLGEVLHNPPLDEFGSILGMASNVLHQTGTLLIIQNLAVEDSNLETYSSST